MIIRIPKKDFEDYKKLMSVSIELSDEDQKKLLDSKAVTIMEE